MAVTIREMVGLEDLTGSRIGTLRVGQMVARRPQPKYRTFCEQCGAESTESQSRIQSGAARCLSSNHGKSTTKRGRDLLADERPRLAEREAQRIADEREAAERRMAAEIDPVDPERREAERREIEEREAAEKREVAESAQRQQAEKQRAYWAEWVQSDPDPKLVVSDAMRFAKMPTKDAETFTADQAARFATSPEYAAYRTPQNADVILEYLHRNGIRIADVETITAAFVRLRDLGLLKAKSSPAPPQPVEQPKRVNLTIDPGPSKPVAKSNLGKDQRTGEIREFSDFEIRKMSAEEFKRSFGIVPTVSELFTALSDSR